MKKEIPIEGVVKLMCIWRPESVPFDAFRAQMEQRTCVVSTHDALDLTEEEGYLEYLAGLISADEKRRTVPHDELRDFLALAKKPFDAMLLIVPEGMDEDDIRDILNEVSPEYTAFVPSLAWTNEIARLIGLGHHYEYAAIHAALVIAGIEEELVLANVRDGGENIEFDSQENPLLDRAIAIAEELDIGTEAHLMFARLAAELANICAVDWEAERLDTHPANILPTHESAGLLRGADMAATQ